MTEEPKPLKVVMKNVAELEPYRNNAKIHGQKQIEMIADSIVEFGSTNSILTDGANGLIAGQHRPSRSNTKGVE